MNLEESKQALIREIEQINDEEVIESLLTYLVSLRQLNEGQLPFSFDEENSAFHDVSF